MELNTIGWDLKRESEQFKDHSHEPLAQADLLLFHRGLHVRSSIRRQCQASHRKIQIQLQL